MVWGYGKGRTVHSIGNNFLAEIAGVTIAAMIAPNFDCEIVSDSKAVIDCVSGRKFSDRERARLPCRGCE